MFIVELCEQYDRFTTVDRQDPEIKLKFCNNRYFIFDLVIIVGFGLEPGIFRDEGIGRMQILLVEDDLSLRQALLPFLREAGFDVDVAFNGDEGLARARQFQYDAIILEDLETDREGSSILNNLRQNDIRTPLLILTSKDSVVDSVKCLDSGADHCLVKPFDMSELEARLRALIRRASIAPSWVMEVGPVVIDKTAKAVTVNGNRIPLTNKEYQLLEFLIENRGNVVARTKIYERLFNEIDTAFANLVDVYVSNIRRKLGHPLIKTLRGRGYMIEE